MPDNSVQIAALESILNAGTESTAVDGLSVKYDLSEVRKRLLDLKATDTSGNSTRRPMFVTINTPYF